MTPATGAAALIEKAIALVPNLTHFGVGLYRPETFDAAATTAGIAAGQVQLRAAVHEVALCAEWLAGIGPTKRAWRGASSYGYKHGVEGWLRRQGRPAYIVNGSFIAAAVGLGYPFAIQQPNVYFGFSAKRLKRARQRSLAAAAVV